MRSARTALLFLLLRHLPPGFLVAPLGHELADRAARRPELHRHDAGVADDLAAERADALLRSVHVRNLDGEVMDARPLARGARLSRLRAGVVFDEREVDRAVAQMPRGMVAHLVGIHLGEA